MEIGGAPGSASEGAPIGGSGPFWPYFPSDHYEVYLSLVIARKTRSERRRPTN